MGRKLKVLLVLTFFIAVTGASAYWFIMRDNEPAEVDSMPTDGKLHMLVLGVDPGWVAPGKASSDGGRSDTIMLATYDPDTGEVSLLSIPRDTRVEVPGHGMTKINHAYAYGGVELTLQTVRKFLNVPIRYYVKIDTTGFVRLVDAIGGVTIDVEKDMDWDDNAGNLHIHLKKGVQTLNGEDANGYVRFRHTDSDMARAARQQKFISAAIKQVLKPANLLKIPQLINLGFESVDTNISLTTILRYSKAVASLKDGINSYTVEGTDQYIDGIYYYIPNMEQVEQVVEDYFYSGIDRTANSAVRVAVQYGNGDRSSANEVATLLRKVGFEVTSVTRADSDEYLVTEVISVNKDTAPALRVAETISAPEVLLDPKAMDNVDVVVIVGKDMLP